MDGRPDGHSSFMSPYHSKLGMGRAMHHPLSYQRRTEENMHAGYYTYRYTTSPSTFVCPRPSVRPFVFHFFFLFCFVPFSFFSSPSSSFPPSSFIARSALTFCGNSSDSKSVPGARNGFSLLASALFPFFFPFLGVDMTGKEKERR